jgi:hypothetical protein
MGRKAYATRVDFEMDGILNTDTYYTMEGIISLGRRSSLDLQVQAKDTSHQLEGKHISVGKQYAIKLLWLYRDYHGFRRASNYNKKAGKPWPQLRESACCKRCQQRRQRPFCYGRILYWRCSSYTSRVNSRGFTMS